MVLTRPDQIRRHWAPSAALSLVRLPPAAQRDPSAIGDGDVRDAMRVMVSDVTLSSHPPLAAVADVLRILYHRDEVELDAAAGESVRDYRLRVVVPWLRDDGSLAALGPVARSRRGPARLRFQRLLARELGRAFHRLCRFPVRIDCPCPSEALAICATAPERDALAVEREALRRLAAAMPPGGRLLDDEQVAVLRYARDEADVLPLREVHRVRARLRPVGLRVARTLRGACTRQREVRDERSPAMGGYSGLRSGGSLEHLDALLPSELAQMESGSRADVFDLNLVEKRLLYFKRDQQVDLQRRRRYHVVCAAPERFDYRGNVVPARWPYLLLAVVFDVVRLFRDELALAAYPFHFVFGGKAAELDRFERLVTAIREQDFPELEIHFAAVAPEQLPAYLQEPPGEDGDEHLLLCLAEPDAPWLSAVPPTTALVRIELAAGEDGDRLVLDDGDSRHAVAITDEAGLDKGLNRFRNLLAASMASAHGTRRS
jgi:hypothetical protein